MPLPIRMLLSLILLLAGPVCAAAGETRTASLAPALTSAALPRHLNAIGGTNPPIGYVRFCADNGEDCTAKGEMAFEVALDATHYAELEKINRSLNEAVEPMTDLEHYGETERWAYPVDGKGDARITCSPSARR